MRFTEMLHALSLTPYKLVKWWVKSFLNAVKTSFTRKASKKTMKLVSPRLELASPDPLGQGWRMFLVRLPSPVKGPYAGFSARFQRVERGRRVPFCTF